MQRKLCEREEEHLETRQVHVGAERRARTIFGRALLFEPLVLFLELIWEARGGGSSRLAWAGTSGKKGKSTHSVQQQKKGVGEWRDGEGSWLCGRRTMCKPALHDMVYHAK